MQYSYMLQSIIRITSYWHVQCSQLNQPISWRLLNSTKATLTKADPISKWNAVAMKLTSDDVNGGIVNTGFWGIAINGGWIYHFSMYIKGNEDAKVRLLQDLSMSADAAHHSKCARCHNIFVL